MKITSALLAAQAMSRIDNLSPDTVYQAVVTGAAIVIDIREKSEILATGTIPSAIHIPRGVLEFAVDPGSPVYRAELTPEEPLILMCDTGHRSALATETLTALGFSHVAHLRGGFNAWVRQGLPIEQTFDET